FHAEDGIRDFHVTGLQTCALPILIQVYLRREEVGDEAFERMKQLDIGDFVWARGHVMRTRTGELSVQAREIRLAAKTMMPFPDRARNSVVQGKGDGMRARRVHDKT